LRGLEPEIGDNELAIANIVAINFGEGMGKFFSILLFFSESITLSSY
jgi:hypothetical protein